MNSKSVLSSSLLVALLAAFAIGTTAHGATYTWANSNETSTPAATLNWLNPTQGTWTGGTPVSGSANTIQFFQDFTTALLNTGATGNLQTSNIDNGGSAFQLGTLTLNGKASATTGANLNLTISGDALNFSAATGTINLNGVNATRILTYNLNSNIQLGTVGSADALTITGAGTGTFNIGGNITELQAGGGSLVKSGASTLTLSGSNSYTGTTTVTAGTLLATTANALSGYNTSGKVVFNGGTISAQVGASGWATSEVDALLSNATKTSGAFGIDTTNGNLTQWTPLTTSNLGSLGLTKSGTNTLTLDQANSFTGATSVAAGYLKLANSNALGSSTSVAITSGAELDLGGNITVSGPTVTIIGGGVSNGVGSLQSASGTNTWAGNLIIGSNLARLGAGANSSLIVSGTISGAAAVAIAIRNLDTTGLTTFTGANTYDAPTTVINGLLSVGSLNSVTTDGAKGTVHSASSNLGAPTNAANGLINLGTFSDQITLRYTGTGETTDRQVALISWTGPVTIDQSGLGLLKFITDFSHPGNATNDQRMTLTLTGSTAGTGEIAGAIGDAVLAPANQAALSLAKTGTGTWTLSGSNNYTGTTSVSAGVLAIQNNSALGTGTASVSSGAALQLQSGSGITVWNVLNLAGSGISNDGALRNISGSNTLIGPVNLATDARINTDGGTLYLTSGSFALGNYALTVGGNGNTVIGSVLSGSGGLTKDGSGTLTLTASNSYLGNTLLSTGTLSIGDGTAGHDGSIASSSGINFGSASASLVYNLSSTASQTYSAGITGSGSLILWGSTSLTLTGTNSYTGATTINTGTLTLGGAGLLGTGSYGGAITNNGAFVYNSSASQTLSGNLTGTGSLTQAGAGTLTLSSSNSFSGGTTLSAGILNYSNLNALGSGTMTFSGNATLQAGVSGTVANPMVINSSRTGTLDTGGTNMVLSGTLSGSGALYKIGVGNLTLSASNSYSGGTILGGLGTVELSANNALGSGSLTIGDASNGGSRFELNSYSQTITNLLFLGTNNKIIQNGGVYANSTGTGTLILSLASGTVATPSNFYFRDSGGSNTGSLALVKNGAGTLDFSLYAAMIYSGGLAVNGGAFAFNNVAALGTGSLTLGGGTLAVTSGSSVTLTKNAALTASTTSGIDTGSGSVTYSGTLSGAGSIAKSGVGTLTLNRNNPYTGSTAVQGGTLVVSGSLSATASVSVDSGAKLSVDGKVTSPITSAGIVQGQGTVDALNISDNATLAPGVSTANSNNGTLTAAGNVVFVGGSTAQLSIRLGQTSSLGTDTLALASGAYSVNLNGAALNLTLGGSFGTPALNSVYVIINGNSSSLSQGLVISGFFAQQSSITVGSNTFSILYNENSTGTGAGNDVILKLTSVPEPSAWVMLAAGFGLLGLTQRMRRTKHVT